MAFSTLLITLAAFLTLANSSSVLPQHQKRSATNVGQVYAYGGGLSGVPMFVKDSVAYIGDLSKTSIHGTYVTLTQDDDTHLITAPMSPDAADWTTPYLAINTTAGAQDSAILTDASDSAGLTTTGFFMYGSQVAWLSSTGMLEDSWYILPTETENVWSLKWKAGGNPNDVAGAKVVVLKTKSSGSS